jgi:dihydroxyacetone kinase DhaKLM complex PTS-EIIA-like component DhaM
MVEHTGRCAMSGVGIVLISHSRALAEGAADVASSVCQGGASIVGIGGTVDGQLGTSLDALVTAVDKVEAGAGVVIIADLGSSVLTARSYVADPSYAVPDVHLADAPFVEGAVAAAVVASTGAPVEAVLAAAEEARHAHKS